MGEITDLIQSYRECVQQVWNCHFRDLPGGWHEFGDVEDALLYGIVLAQADEYKNWRDESAAPAVVSRRAGGGLPIPLANVLGPVGTRRHETETACKDFAEFFCASRPVVLS